MINNKLDEYYRRLISGDISFLNINTIIDINNYTSKLLQSKNISINELDDMHMILLMSNILYNNTDRDLLILEDGIYDLLLEQYKTYRPDDNSLVGAIPVSFDNYTNQIKELKEQIYEPIIFADDTDKFYLKQIGKVPKITKADMLVDGISFYDGYSARKQLNTAHNYPTLVGTLTKAKFVLSKEAKDMGVYDDPKVKIFERDFIGYHIVNGIISTNDIITIVAELKYDGVSVEADVKGDIIVGARSRGDANNDIAADLTSILYGYQFKHATDFIDPNYEFGVKFEAIMTYSNLKKFNKLKGTEYKNCRTAISGLFNTKDAYKYRDLITLVPIATSMENIDRVIEIEFLNTYYHSGILMKYAVITGNYIDVLFKLKTFVDEAEYMRDYLDFMYDGVVVEYTDEYLINKLGRKNAINQFSYAIKFNPLKKQAYITGLSGTVGKDGVITPMIHYTPVEFMGTTHTKSSLHSYARYLEERPAIGKIADVVYANDVMPYVTIPNNSYNEDIVELIPYLTHCPSCGSELLLSESGKNWYCDNMSCRERSVRRMVDLLDVLNIKGWAYSTLDKLNITSLKKLFSITYEDVEFLGPVNSVNFIDMINTIQNMIIEEHKIIGGLGFTSMSYSTWKLILEKYTLSELMNMYNTDRTKMYNSLINIKGIGNITVMTILVEFDYFWDDLCIISNMNNVIPIKGLETKPTVRFTNCRDAKFLEYLNNNGYDADDKKGVTKTTDYLLIPTKDFNGPSGKFDNAIKNGYTKIIPINEFKSMLGYE